MKKRLLAMGLALLLCVCTVGCGGEKAPSDAFLAEVATNAAMLLSTEFEEGEVLPFGGLLDYYVGSACFVYNEQTNKAEIPPALVPYYDEQTMTFSVPREMVESYLTARFNTTPEAVDGYNAATDCYDLTAFAQDFHYDTVIERVQARSDGRYEFTAKFVHATGELTYRETYIIEMTDGGYRLLARKKIV